jgi:hypothetical protein
LRAWVGRPATLVALHPLSLAERCAAMNIVDLNQGRKRSGFSIVCAECGSLSIKIVDPATAPDTTLVHCGRCGAIRGTLADLHDLARRSTDVFEF